ncbi:CUB and sushi domain-containing protein 1-like [Patiria miniata]|uniref:G-protein coupled receptor GRL101 n=1 Tax=Patiria miniata TaxID=46514 RepID=A0A913ZIZ9_PATMI|nr:CUB and sushi domain-containing protein 1-like [Patiria miniata]
MDGQFLCDTGIQCVNTSMRCNGWPDCEDYSDELGCSVACGPGQLSCTFASQDVCLSDSQICDSTKECDNFLDEISCTSGCGDQNIQLQPNRTHTLASQNAPTAHPAQFICVWFVTAPPITRILVQTLRINLNPGTNLTVGDGPSVNMSHVVWNRQGGTAPSHAVSRSNEIWIAFEDAQEISAFSQPAIAVGDAHFVLDLSILEDFVNCSDGDQFACKDGYRCISSSEVCDGVVQCFDFSDEMSCTDECPDDAARCVDNEGNHVCLNKGDFCNGLENCANYLDETLCSNICGERYINLEEYPDFTYSLSSPDNGFPPQTACLWIFTATPGLIIQMDLVQQFIGSADFFTFGDGTNPSNTSSIISYLPGNHYPIASLHPNGLWMTFAATSGELGSFLYRISIFNTTVSCREDQFQCSVSGLCIDASKHCDGVLSCNDNTDETGCEHCNGISTFNVTNGQSFVLQLSYEPDDVNFPFGRNCVWYVTASAGHRIKITYREYMLSEDNALYFGHGAVLESNAETVSSHSTYTKLHIISETDNLWIALISTSMTSANRLNLEIEELRPVECNDDEFACPSGLACIPQNQVCDGYPQCPMRGDEIGCGPCSEQQYRCPEGSCIDALEQICDGTAHCLDLLDEMNCFPCGESVVTLNNSTHTSATLASLNYPNDYPDYALCAWLITADVGSTIALRFSAFNTERHYDTLTIGNGHAPSDGISVIGRFSSSLTSLAVFSKDHTAWMEFKSDYSLNEIGFEVTITQERSQASCRQDEFACQDASSGLICLARDDTCDGFALCPDRSDESNCGECGPQNIYVYEKPFTLTSPMYPGGYPNDLNCIWLIKGELMTPVTMRIEDFEMEDGFDYLKVVFLGEGERPEELFRLTGADVSRRTVTWDHDAGVLKLQMKTDRTTGRRGFSLLISHYQNFTEEFEEGDLEALCEPDEFHCGNGFCITNSSLCNGYLDCVNYEDELDCNDVFCPGSYKCDNLNTNQTYQPPTRPPTRPPEDSGSSSSDSSSPSSDSSSSSSDSSSSISVADVLPQAQCIPRAQVCDGEENCPESDDEIQCDVKRCPTGCKCSYKDADLVVNCTNGWDSSTLADLALTTHTLQLSGVNISKLDQGMFKGISHLKVLSLRGNLISEIQERTFDGLDKLLWLDLSKTSISELQGSAMEELSRLRGITIFDVPLLRIRKDAFSGLGQVKTLIIVRKIKGLPPLEVEDGAFKGLDDVSELYVDNHRLCCFFPSAECKTLEPQPPLFMCSELMPRMVLKAFMWILGISALVGNIFVMVWRCREKTEGRASRVVHSFLVFNLAVSDALMGLYMLIIASADAYFGERYFEVSMEWRTSPMCKIAGFISIIGSEASVFFLTLISIDRFLSIVFPFSIYHLRPKSSRIAASCVWIGTVIVGLVPTILATDSSSDVYGLSDVCIGLPLMTKVTEYETVDQQIDAGGVANITVGIPSPVDYRASWFFSIALFLGVNLLCFTVILICYIAIFIQVKASIKRVRRHKKRDDEVRMAIKMAAIVMTDFICWIPVIMMGILSQARVVEIPTEAYAWIVVFILPINSSLNPYLYTISDMCSQQRKSASVRKSGLPMKDSHSNSENRISGIVNSVTIETQIDSKADHGNNKTMHM